MADEDDYLNSITQRVWNKLIDELNHQFNDGKIDECEFGAALISIACAVSKAIIINHGRETFDYLMQQMKVSANEENKLS